MKYKEISLKPTPFTVKVFYSEDPSEMAGEFKKRFKIKGKRWTSYFKNADKGCDGFCDEFVSSEGQELVMCLFVLNPGIIAHEAVHIAWYLSKFTDMEFNYSNQETQAYYIQYLVDEIMKIK